jgi:hypothetical protein
MKDIFLIVELSMEPGEGEKGEQNDRVLTIL